MKHFLKKDLFVLPCFIIVSILFFYLFSLSTSSLFKNMYGFDSAIFMVVGKAMSNGKLLYTDIFDHKGPVLFFFQYIGWSLGKVAGIFIIQCVNLTVVMYIIYKMLFLIQESYKHVVIIIISLLSLLCFTNIEGNQSEEYSLIFIFISAYFILSYTLKRDSKIEHPPLYSFIYGICFAFIAFNRITNAASIGAIITGVCLYLLFKSKYQNCLKNIFAFICGTLLTSFLISIPFLLNGRLYDMLYATFIFNIKYSGSINDVNLLEKLFLINKHSVFFFILKITPNLLFIIILVIRFIKTRYLKELLCLGFIPIFTYIAINLGLKNEHYLSINAVPLILSLLLYFDSLQRHLIVRKSLLNLFLVIYIVLMITYFMYQGRVSYKIFKKTQADIETLKQSDFYFVDVDLVKNLIKKGEENSVFGYNLPPEWYLKTNLIPPFKFFTNQENWIKSDSIIYYEVNKYLTDTPPLWIVIPEYRIVPWVVGVDANPVLKELLNTQYELAGKDVNNKYYRRKERK